MKHRILGMATTLITAMMLIGGGAGGIAAAATPTESTPTGSKQVVDTGFNTYDLTLSVEGHDWSNHEPTDILFVLDRTGSVGQERWDKVRTAVEDTSERLIDAGDGNTRIAVGTFTGGYGKGEEVQVALTNSPDWAKFDATSLSTNAVEGGGTSWVEGTQIGSKLMDMSSNDIMKHVVFFSDGEPNKEGGTESAYNAALPGFRDILSHPNTDMTVLSLGDIQLMRQLATDTGGTYLTADDADGLTRQMEDRLAAQTLSGSAKNATITDTLSQYVEPQKLDDKQRPAITVTIDGRAATEDKDYTYQWNAGTRTLTVTDKTTLGGGKRMTVTMPVKPSQTAISEHVAGKAYPAKGDPNTGATSAGKQGYPSNDNATVKWTNPLDGTTPSTTLPKPVIQVETVTLDYKGNGATSGQTDGETVYTGTEVPVAPNGYLRDGYSFLGWNTKADGSGTPYKPGDEIDLTADMTLYAMWEANPARILFDPNAENTTGDTKGIDTVYDADVTLTPNGYERPGYTFTGWSTKPDNTGAGYADKAEYHVTGDVTMYAQWKADKASLVYNANGGTGGMDSVTGVTDQKVAVNENGFTYKGHRFTGWNSMPDGTGDTYNPGDEYTLPVGVGVLYAQWEEIPASLTYDGNGSDVTGETAGYTGIAEDTPIVSENGFDRPGHEFKGWNTKPDGTGDTIQPGDTMTPLPEGDTILYAQWDELPATVTYDPNGGTGTTSPYNGLVGDTPQAADNGFAAPDDCKTFAGWNTAKDGSGTVYKPGDTLPSLTDDITLYAQWDDTGCEAEGLAQTGVGLSRILTVVGLMLTVGGLATVVQRKRA